MYLRREIETTILKALGNNPVIAIIGPRQCGKSTLVKELIKKFPESVYLDLERPSDLNKLNEAEWFLSNQKNKLICIDEVQRKPELFPLLRSLSDEWNINGSFIVLGSASRDLLKQSSESLAGRISYKHLSPFLWCEIENNYSLERYIERGGFPKSILPDNPNVSLEWRIDFISTFLERDLRQWMQFNPRLMHRLWQMLAHYNGQLINYTSIGNSLGISNVSIKTYIDILQSTFMVEVLPPYFSNMGKRLVKTPKVYVADHGITSALLGLENFEQIQAHPVFGAIWEQIVLINLKALYPQASFCFYRTAAGAEIDIVMVYQQRVFAFECKASLSPLLRKGVYHAMEDIKPEKTFVVAPVKSGWAISPLVRVINLSELKQCTE